MHCLVTGGGGFLGRYIVEQLVARGDRVRTFSRGRYPELEALGVEPVQGDLADADRLRTACRGVEAVFHTAAVPGVWGPWKQFYETNVVGTRNVLSACRAEGVSKLIFTSSPSVVYDGRPHENANESLPYPETYLCHYPHTKALAEREVLAADGREGLSTVSLRPHLIWGPRDRHLIPRILQRAARGRLRRVGDGMNLISVSYVENVAHAHLQACDALRPGSPVAGHAYFVNEPQPVNLWEFVGDIVRRAGLPPVTKSISAGAAWRIGAALEGVYRLLRLPSEPPMTRFVASQLSTSHWYDVSAAKRDFGYDPEVSVEEGLHRMEQHLRWFVRPALEAHERPS
jgi:nucleoside-diphosphate-sugar epimerase